MVTKPFWSLFGAMKTAINTHFDLFDVRISSITWKWSEVDIRRSLTVIFVFFLNMFFIIIGRSRSTILLSFCYHCCLHGNKTFYLLPTNPILSNSGVLFGYFLSEFRTFSCPILQCQSPSESWFMVWPVWRACINSATLGLPLTNSCVLFV